MSQEDLTQFLQAVQQDSSLQEKLKTEGADPVAVAGEAGYSIAPEEWKEHLTRISEEDLKNVAGGEGDPLQRTWQLGPGERMSKEEVEKAVRLLNRTGRLGGERG